MPRFSRRSTAILADCDHHLRILFEQVIKFRDCTVICGFRGKADQDKAYWAGRSKLCWPDSLHNQNPSRAVDVAPYINGRISYDPGDCRVFAGVVLGVAYCLNLGDRIRWGGDWDRDADTTDQTFNDLVHFEIKA